MITKLIHQYEVYLVNLDPTVRSEINKTRPCLIISPEEMNFSINTVIIAPLTTKRHIYPTRVGLSFNGKQAWVVLDQIRTIDKKRLIKPVGKIHNAKINEIRSVLKEMLID